MDPFDEKNRFEKMIKDMLEGLFGGSSVNVITPFRGSGFGPKQTLGSDEREPLTDVFETKDEIIITMELPGASKEDIELDANPNGLEIIANIRKVSMNKNSRSSSFTRFKKYVGVPAEVDPNTVKAKYKNGILEVKLKKLKKQKGKKVKID